MVGSFYRWVVLIICLTAAGLAQVSREARKAATDGLARYAASFNPNFENRLGLTSSDEFRRATLGEPLPIYQVKLDLLAKYTINSDPTPLLNDAHMLCFPILVDGMTKATVRVQREGDKWRMVSLGRPLLAQAVAEEKQALRQAGADPSFILEVPTQNIAFLGSNESGDLMLTSLYPNNALRMATGTRWKARQIFSALALSLQDTP
jgi:hypothetical protein